MKTVFLIISSLFYKYYDQGSTKQVLYLSTIGALFGLIILNTGTILFYFDLQRLFPGTSSDTKIIHYIYGFVIFFLFYFLARWTLPEKEVKAYEIEPDKRRLYGYLLIGYIIFSLLVFVFILNGKYKF